MSFTEAIKACFSKYATFSGRAPRSEYWWFALFTAIVSAILGAIDRAMFGVDPVTQTSNGLFATLFSLAVLLPVMAVGWRRMHDTGKPGWYLLVPMAVSFATFAVVMMGVVSFTGLQHAGVDEEALRGAAVVLGYTGMMVVAALQLVFAILLLWWLTRPSDPQANDFGPPPL